MRPILFTMLLFNSLTYCQNNTLNSFTELETYDKRRWLTIGIGYESFNNLYGFNFSNGFDLQNVVHFEDFQDNLIFKFSFFSDFNDDYTFDSNIGLLLRSKIFNRVALNYSKKQVEKGQFEFENISLRLKSRYFGNSYVLLDIGKQRINEFNNYGFDIGLRTIIKDFHFGLLIGYYSDYYNYGALLEYNFFQDYNNHIDLRFEYKRYDVVNFLNIGIQWSFIRK